MYGTATATYTLIHDHEMEPEDAAEFVRDAGIEHENDSQLKGTHYENARSMDLHNNEVGIALGIEAATGTGMEPELKLDALHSIADGDAWMLPSKESGPRPTSVVDLGVVAGALRVGYGLS